MFITLLVIEAPAGLCSITSSERSLRRAVTLQSEWTISRRELPRASLFTEVSGRAFSDVHPAKKKCHLAYKKVPPGRRARHNPLTYFPHSSNKERIE
jgi:hypothetical protein